MATQGPLYPGTTGNDATVGTIDWVNPDNAKVEDGVNTTAAVINNATSHYLTVTNFGFSIPTGATINGITVEVRKQKSPADSVIKDNSIKLIKGGTISGTDKSTSGVFGVSLAYATYGSASDLWGLAFTPSDINASNFGVSFSAIDSGTDPSGSAQVDDIRITVDYTALGFSIALIK